MSDTSLSDEISIRHLTFAVRSQGNLIDDLQRASREHWDRIQHQARQIHDLNLTLRLERCEKPEPKDTINRRLKALDEKAFTVGLTCEESDERTWLIKRISLMMAPPPVGNAYTTPEGWAEKVTAVAQKCCGHDPQTIEDAIVGKAWREDSSLEKWFPFSAEELKNLRDHWPAIISPSEASDNPIVENAVKRIMNSLAGGHYDQQHVIMLKRIHSLGHQGSEFPVDTIAAWVRQGVEYAVETTAEPKWRDAKTDPPAVSGRYLIAVYGEIAAAGYRHGLRTWRSAMGTVYTDDSVTHWQELPAPPTPA